MFGIAIETVLGSVPDKFSAFTMADKANEAEISQKLENLPIDDSNEPPKSKAVGGSDKVC